VLSERKLIQLVAENHVDGPDDPGMPASIRNAVRLSSPAR
jgi:hypothetical protein